MISSIRDQRSSAREEGWLLKTLQTQIASKDDNEFHPVQPSRLAETGLHRNIPTALILKVIWNRGTITGQEISNHIRLPFNVVDEILRTLKDERIVAYKRSSGLNDYLLELTSDGIAQAERFNKQSTYFGAAPVPFSDFVDAVAAQSIQRTQPTLDSLRAALSDLSIPDPMLSTLGQALTAGQAIFLYGTPGNGKTSIAERVTGAFGKHIWIPRCLEIDGDLVRLFDPIVHTEAKETGTSAQFDRRWVRIERPTIVVGGELQMEHLEIAFNSLIGIGEAPMHLKSSCGTFVIDDFGRQRMSPTELLNRWIVPLEKRFDFLSLPSGKKIQVPFDQLLIFSTNLEPKEIVDEAFLRRIPYKLEVCSPDEASFREVFGIMANKLGIGYAPESLDYLIQTHYRNPGRPFRFCQPRDLLLQVRNFCVFHGQRPEATRETLDLAVENYFGIMG